ncbi:LysR family transcriptional regulator [Roseovarius sp. C7]|uniref:LysR family transcriptional regulator n=1 Tax=Roseovarius sp. C7 TaxID=3398643 RepID=UPI0039F6B358
MNIAAIQTFLAVYRCGNLNRAAEELNVTQSAVTARLDALETQLGARLLIRSRKGAELTKAGFAFLKQAELIWQSWEVARARISLPRGMSRLCSLVVAPGLWQGLAAPWVTDLRAQHSQTAFEIWTGLASDATRWLQSGLSDAALLAEPLSGADLDTHSLPPRPCFRWPARRARPVIGTRITSLSITAPGSAPAIPKLGRRTTPRI